MSVTADNPGGYWHKHALPFRMTKIPESRVFVVERTKHLPRNPRPAPDGLLPVSRGRSHVLSRFLAASSRSFRGGMARA